MKKQYSQGLALALLLGLSQSAYATPVSYDLSEMVITASRMELNVKELPQSAQIITKNEIKAIGATNLKDVLRLVPSMFVSETTGLASIVKLRGSSDYVVLMNGHRLAEEVSMMEDDFRWEQMLNVQNIERIEILRGPSSALYGSNAEAGVINIITKSADEAGGVIGVTTGKREMSNYYRYDTGKEGKLSAALDANFTKIRPYLWEDASSTKREGPKQSFNLDAKYEMDEDNSLKLFLEYENADLTYRNVDKQTGKILPERHDADRERKSAVLGYAGKSDKSNYTLDTTYSRLDADGVRDFWNVDLRNRVKSTDRLTLTYGAEYSKDKGEVSINHVAEDKAVEQAAAYVYGEYRLNDKLLAISSLRYDHHDSFGSEYSPSIGMTYFLDDSTRIKAIYGEGYKAPTTEQLYTTWEASGVGPHGFALVGNPDLQPESSKGYEFSLEKDLGPATSTKLTYYKRDKKDAIIMDLSHLREENWVQMVNVDEADFEGVEFALNHDFGHGLSGSFNYEYLDAQRTEGGKDRADRLPYTARNTYTARLQWTEPKEQEWSVTIWNKWFSDYLIAGGSGHSHNDKKKENKSINTFNIVVNKSWDDNKYNAFVGLDNVFDKELVEMRYSGRVWRCGAEMHF